MFEALHDFPVRHRLPSWLIRQYESEVGQFVDRPLETCALVVRVASILVVALVHLCFAAVAGVLGTGAPVDALVNLRFAAVAGVLGEAPAVALVDLRLGVAAALGITVATFFCVCGDSGINVGTFFCVCGDSGINVGALGGPSPI